MIKYLSDLGVMYMIKSNQILDEKDKRLRKKSIDVTFPLEDKYKKFIDESIEMLTLSQIEEEAEKMGIKKKTLRNAKMELGIDSVKRGNQWYWMLSE